MRTLLLVVLLAGSVAAQAPDSVTVLIDGREIKLDTSKASHRAVRDSLLAWRAKRVTAASTAIKTAIVADSTFAAVLDSTGITLAVDRLDESYVRVRVPATERLLVAARAQWLLDGAVAAEGDTIRATGRQVKDGLTRLAPFYR